MQPRLWRVLKYVSCIVIMYDESELLGGGFQQQLLKTTSSSWEVFD